MTEIKKIKPALSKGTRDFLPVEVAKRNYIFDTIKGVFRKYGFEEIETPAIERMETLTGKYGEEGDKLLFKILNSGDFLKDAPKEELAAANSAATLKHIAEKGLRYDLTVPLARYVVQHQENLAFPFKRFHIGPVWRADRPQKGRYQEFYQCDADVIGSESLLNEVELTLIYAEAFKNLGVDVIIRFNHRKVIEALIAVINKPEFSELIIGCIDKMDKMPWEKIEAELLEAGMIKTEVDALYNSIVLKADTLWLDEDIKSNTVGQVAFNELSDFTKVLGASFLNVVYDGRLARGLNYYTGVIWEVVLDKKSAANANITMGSLGGGGRYDNLTEMFGAKNMTGVGISFGIERIYDVMEELKLFPPAISQGVKVLFVPREPEMETFAFQQAQVLRNRGIGAEVYLGNVKKQKHFNYVDDKQIRYIVEVGSNEQTTGLFRLRNVQTRDTQSDLTVEAIAILLQA
jgi:histidyl-tRNA synthetase